MPNRSSTRSVIISCDSAGEAWFALLDELYNEGVRVSPRGQPCRELLDVTWRVGDAYRNLFVHPVRKLQYRFAVAEWLHIFFGHDDVASIAPYNPQIAKFSDDGVVFQGAYGPRFGAQLPLVRSSLVNDPDSRQAVVSIYAPPTGPTKDVACTLTWQALLRDRRLNIIVNMRSSDIWLGLPYDCFNMSMLGNILAGWLNVKLGWITFHLGSSHLYERDAEQANGVLRTPDVLEVVRSPQLPGEPPAWLHYAFLSRRREDVVRQDPWYAYGQVLCTAINKHALDYLRILCPA